MKTDRSFAALVVTHRLVVQPEGHPGDGDGHGAGHVDRHDEEGQLAGEQQLHPQTRVRAWSVILVLEGIAADRKINSIALKLLETLDLSKVLS